LRGHFDRIRGERCSGRCLYRPAGQCPCRRPDTPTDGLDGLLDPDLLQFGGMVIQGPLEGLSKILEQMKAIGHLDGGGGAPLGPTGVEACPIAANDFDPRTTSSQ
jgi:hypothetical protein